jgi:hypothetical protein
VVPLSLTRGRLSLALLIAAGAAAAILLMISAPPERAAAAPCPIPSYGYFAGDVTIAGNSPCDDEPEDFRVYCQAGNIWFDYTVNGVLQGNIDTAIACGAAARLRVFGNFGDDKLDLSAVSAGNGFTGLNKPNQLEGNEGADTIVGTALADATTGGSGRDLLNPGPGNDSADGGSQEDLLLLRDGGPDTADCGSEFDSAQADQQATDGLANCELADYLPAAASPSPGPSQKKCKKKRKGRAATAKKCKKRRAAT